MIFMTLTNTILKDANILVFVFTTYIEYLTFSSYFYKNHSFYCFSCHCFSISSTDITRHISPYVVVVKKTLEHLNFLLLSIYQMFYKMITFLIETIACKKKKKKKTGKLEWFIAIIYSKWNCKISHNLSI